MRKSLLALSVGGLLAASAVFAAPAEANHRWSQERGWNAGHGRPARVVVVTPRREMRRDVVIVKKIHKPRRYVVINRDGSRSYVVRRPAPRVVYLP